MIQHKRALFYDDVHFKVQGETVQEVEEILAPHSDISGLEAGLRHLSAVQS
jgi:hypothetical protein